MSDIRMTAKLKGAADVARSTRPFGFSEAAKKRGEKAVVGDVRGVFAIPSQAFEELRKSDPAAADRFWANVQNRRFARAQAAPTRSGSGWNDLRVGRPDPSLHKGGHSADQSRSRWSPARRRSTRTSPASSAASDSPRALWIVDCGLWIAAFPKPGEWIQPNSKQKRRHMGYG